MTLTILLFLVKTITLLFTYFIALMVVGIFAIIIKVFGHKVAKIFILIAIPLFILGSIYFYDSAKIIATYKSPDNNYEIVLKLDKLEFDCAIAMPGHGGIGDEEVWVILKHKGREIDRSSRCLWGVDIEVEWLLDRNKVKYTDSRYFNLPKTKE